MHVWRVDLQLRASHTAFALIIFLHLAAAFALLQSSVPLELASWLQVWCRGSLLVVLALSLVLSCRQQGRQAGITVREQSVAWWLQTDAHAGVAELMHAQVWRWLVVMDFRWHDGARPRRQRVVVLPDAVTPDTFRRLRVRLRHGPRQPHDDDF